MQHTIPVEHWVKKIGPQTEEMASAIETCVHCGFCLAVCPTYQVLEEEPNSPRGRILLMRSVLEGDLTLQEAMPYLSPCRGCLACVTACPSGVHYGELITPFRAYARAKVPVGFMTHLQHTLVEQTLPYPGRFRSAAVLGRLIKPWSGILPEELQSMLSLLPEQLPVSQAMPALVEAVGARRARAALLVGCVQQVLSPEINWATTRVLAKNGVEVVIPEHQCCCGALLMHTGDHEQARVLARQNLRVFPEDVDVVLTNAAGCGSGMKEYGLLFKGQPEEEKASKFAHKVQDISEFLFDLGLVQPSPLPQPLKAAYHDACHLTHAQGISLEPRSLLSKIPNLTLLEIVDSSMCCGSAGTYNLEQPKIASELGERKAKNILESGCEAIVTGNIGCMVQIRNHLQSLGKMLPIFHTIELMDMAYSNDGGSGSSDFQ